MKKVIVLCTAAALVIASCGNPAGETPVATTDTTAVVADSACCDTVQTVTAVTGAVDSPAVVK